MSHDVSVPINYEYQQFALMQNQRDENELLNESKCPIIIRKSLEFSSDLCCSGRQKTSLKETRPNRRFAFKLFMSMIYLIAVEIKTLCNRVFKKKNKKRIN